MSKLNNIAITTSILTGTVYIGRLDSKGHKFLEKREASGEIARAFIQWMDGKKDNKVKFANGEEFEIIIKKVKEADFEEKKELVDI